MFRKSDVLVTLGLIYVLGAATAGLSQCKNEITLVPLTAQKAATKARDFVRFKYSLSASDSLLIRSHEDAETSIGPYDTGLVITRNSSLLQHISLPPEFEEGSSTLAVTRACGSTGPIYFVTTQRWGDEISPAVVFIFAPSAHEYQVTILPTISGGVVEVSKADPFHIRAWDSLHEGDCNACETAYRITEYEIRKGKPIRVHSYRTRHLYSSGNDTFDDRRRIRFIQ